MLCDMNPYVAQGLRERGIPIREDVTTVEEAKAAILELLGNGGGGKAGGV